MLRDQVLIVNKKTTLKGGNKEAFPKHKLGDSSTEKMQNIPGHESTRTRFKQTNKRTLFNIMVCVYDPSTMDMETNLFLGLINDKMELDVLQIPERESFKNK